MPTCAPQVLLVGKVFNSLLPPGCWHCALALAGRQVAGTPLRYNCRRGSLPRLNTTIIMNPIPPDANTMDAVRAVNAANVPFIKLKLAMNPCMCQL